MSGAELRHRLLAIFAADAAGYSRLISIDERATVAALDRLRAARRALADRAPARFGRQRIDVTP